MRSIMGQLEELYVTPADRWEGYRNAQELCSWARPKGGIVPSLGSPRALTSSEAPT